jgi:MGT family glycosyltransferase
MTTQSGSAARRLSILLAIWDAGGGVPPVMSVARGLVARGHDVRILADPVMADEVGGAGARHVPWTTAPHKASRGVEADLFHDWEARTPMGAFARLRDGLMTGPAAAFAADARAEIARSRPDVVLVDQLLLGVLVAAEADGIPAVSLAPNFLPLPGWGVPPLGSGLQPARGPIGRARDAGIGRAMRATWDRGLRDLNGARAANGLEPVASVLDQVIRADRVLVLTSAALEFPSYAPPANVVLAGARVEDPAWVEPWSPPAGDEPLVLVSMSSSYMKHERLLGRVAAALGELPVRGLITTGPSLDPTAIPVPANVAVVASAPHAEVLRHAAAVVTHGGHGTAIKALAAGVPLVVAPLGRDQPDVAARVVHAGAGVRVGKSASVGRLRTAIRRVLDDPSYAAAAKNVATAIAAERRQDRAVAEIEGVAGADDPAPALAAAL